MIIGVCGTVGVSTGNGAGVFSLEGVHMPAVSRNVSVESDLLARMQRIGKAVNWSAVAVAAWGAECKKQEMAADSCRYCGREYDDEDKEPKETNADT